ncbi:outer membrane beta-barrel family protein [Mucilaginibacter lacusdianchii]|uniref:outer membrane beta-barrel family protein n=1 Tax=Mucilaginibacter lacusdianchii TaxID=2684211 RepID=UPI00131EAF6D|nr:outer membrane beta-barrel family protein [Mucilaginibacter sp. JXJ CY 39]
MKLYFYRGSILSFLLFFSIIHQSAAQAISGRIIETVGKGIENANITVLNATDSSVVKYGVSDKQGYFELTNLNNGVFILKITCIGYHTRLLNNIKFNSSSIKLTDIVLGVELKKLHEVTIVQKTPILQRKVDRLIFNLNSTIMATGSSLFEALRVAPFLTVSDNSVSMVGKGSMGVMINEKLINLSGTDLTNYLKTLRSENVEKIEIITTPPAKYEAQGNAGLINIVLKKNESLGWRGSLSSSFIQRTCSSNNNNLALFFRSKKVSSSFTFNQSNYRGVIKESNDITGQPNPILSNGQRVTTTPNLQASLSIDYELNKQNNVGFIYNISDGKARTTLNNKSSFNTGNTVDSVLNTIAEISRPLFTQTLNIYHDLKIDSTGKKLNSSVNFFTNKPEIKNDFISESDNNYATVRNNSFSKYNIWSFQSDLTLPYKRVTIETGIKFTNFNNSADVEYYNYIHESFLLDKTRSNAFNYTENNLASYISTESELSKKWTVKAGLRYEYTFMDGYSPTLDQRNKRSYGALFPTTYLIYKANGNDVFSLNYSRRINRPGLNFLNPFAFYSNIYSYSVGNPLLLPSYSNNIELSYLYKGMFSFTVFTQHTSDLFSSITTVNGPSVISRVENYLSQDNLGAYASFNRALFKWWDNSITASFSFVSSKSTIENISTQNGTSASFNVNNNFKATPKLSFYLNYSQTLPSTGGNVYTYGQSNLTAGARLKLLNNNLIISSSILKGTASTYDIRFSDFVQTIKTDYDYKTFNLGLTYLFGRSKVSGNNKNISFEEKKRAQK